MLEEEMDVLNIRKSFYVSFQSSALILLFLIVWMDVWGQDLTVELHAVYVPALKYRVEFLITCFLNISFMHLIGKLLNLVTGILL